MRSSNYGWRSTCEWKEVSEFEVAGAAVTSAADVGLLSDAEDEVFFNDAATAFSSSTRHSYMFPPPPYT